MNDNQHIRPDTEAEEEVNLWELVRVVVRNLPLIVRFTAIVAVCSLLLTFVVKNVYTAKATMLPPQKDSAGGAAALLAQIGGGLGSLAGGLGGGGTSDLYMGILKSRSVGDAVIKRLNLQSELKAKNADDARKKLQKLVKFQSGKEGIITITADYKDPVKAALLANTFVDELQNKSLQLNLTKAGTEKNFLEKRLVGVKQDLKAAEDEMKSFQEKNKTIKADSQAAAAIEGIARLKAEIVSKEVQLSALRYSMTDESPEVRSLLAAITRMKGQLGSMSGGGNEGGVIPAAGSVPAIGVEYIRRLRELKMQEAIFEQLTKQYELAKINAARDSSALQVLDEAVVPIRKSKPKRALIVLLSTVTAFFGALFYVFVKEYLSNLSPEDSSIRDEIKANLKSMLQPGAPKSGA